MPHKRLRGFLSLTILLGASAAFGQPVPTGSELQINAYTTGNQDFAEVAVAQDGSFIVVFESQGQDGASDAIALRRFDVAGDPVGTETVVNSTTLDDQQDPAIGLGADGTFVVVWDSDSQDGDQRGIFAQRFDALGDPVGSEAQVNAFGTGDQNDPVVARTPDGGYVVVWEDEDPDPSISEDLVARRFEAGGTPIGAEIDVNVVVGFDQEDAEIGADAAGNFVIAWESEAQDGIADGIFARQFEADGSPVGVEFQVNTFTLGNQANPALAVHPGGSFVIVWEDDTQDLPGQSVYARRYDSSGAAITGQILVGAASDDAQSNPAVALDAHGNALVVWDVFGPDGSEEGVYSISLDADGNALDTEQLINTSTTGPQQFPIVGSNGLGHLVVVWEDDFALDGDATGLFAQRLTTSFFTDGFETGDVTSWSSSTP